MNKIRSTQDNLNSLLHELTAGDVVPLPDGELTHQQRIEAMSRVGRIVAIDEDKWWWWFLEVLPPRWMNGSAFAFAEGWDCFRLFWKPRNEFFVRQLSEAETDLFCQLSGTSRSS